VPNVLREIAPRRHNYFLIGDKIYRHFRLLVFVATAKSSAKFRQSYSANSVSLMVFGPLRRSEANLASQKRSSRAGIEDFSLRARNDRQWSPKR
jgi:hypothetical protein